MGATMVTRKAMKYLIHTRYCWYDTPDGEKLVFMYFIQNVPFTFDELPEIAKEDLEIVTLADENRRWEICKTCSSTDRK